MRHISPILSTPSAPVPVANPLGWFPTWIVGRRYYAALAPFSVNPPFVRLSTTPGLKDEARPIDGKELAYLRLAVNESEYSSVFAK